MTARFIIGDTRAVTATLPDGSVDFLMTSPPYFKQRDYLPVDHPDKSLEIGQEPDPIFFVNMLLDLTAEWRRVLAPHGSIVVELGDKYAGSGGAGGDYDDDGLREGQPRFGRIIGNKDLPPDKSLCCTAELYQSSLAYGWRPFTREVSPAGRWQIRNKIRRCSPNPPVGALGKKWRPATSELVVACPDDDKRYWDDVATRTVASSDGHGTTSRGRTPEETRDPLPNTGANPAGAPLLDWWKITPTGYPGAHYATWPPELCIAPIEAMCPRRVCRTCGEPSRRETSEPEYVNARSHQTVDKASWVDGGELLTQGAIGRDNGSLRSVTTEGWSTCGCPGTDGQQLNGYHTGTGWRPGVVFDPFAGTGTTLSVATGHGRDAIGIDLDPRNADLAMDRVGPLMLTVEHHARDNVA